MCPERSVGHEHLWTRDIACPSPPWIASPLPCTPSLARSRAPVRPLPSVCLSPTPGPLLFVPAGACTPLRSPLTTIKSPLLCAALRAPPSTCLLRSSTPRWGHHGRWHALIPYSYPLQWVTPWPARPLTFPHYSAMVCWLTDPKITRSFHTKYTFFRKLTVELHLFDKLHGTEHSLLRVGGAAPRVK